MNSRMPEMCEECSGILADHETIWSAEGTLYCSEECGIKAYTRIHGEQGAKYFLDVAEEICPEDIGIAPVCSRCDQETDELFSTNYGKLCDICIRALRSRGEAVTIYSD